MRDENNPFIICPDCLNNRSKLKGILCDFFPEERLKVNVLLAAFDESVVDMIQRATKLDNVLANRLVRILISDYGISEDNARFSTEYWFSRYGNEVLAKPYSLSFEDVKATSPKQKSAPQTPPRPVLTPTAEVISIKDCQEKSKLPKSIIHRNIADEQKYGITDFRCSIFKDYDFDRYSSLKITGEYTGKTTQYLLIMFMAYNANDTLIDASFGYEINNDFEGHETFSESLDVPTDEYISKVVVRIVPDPVFAD